jgi:hypothetical protein
MITKSALLFLLSVMMLYGKEPCSQSRVSCPNCGYQRCNQTDSPASVELSILTISCTSGSPPGGDPIACDTRRENPKARPAIL